MTKKTYCRHLLILVSFMLLIIGEATFVDQIFGYTIEYCGYFVLLSAIIYYKIKKFNFKQIIFAFIVFTLWTIGFIFQKVSIGTKISLYISMLFITIITILPDNLLSDVKSIKMASTGLIIGFVISAIIGVFTNTFGMSYNPRISYVGVLFTFGIRVKNYCGGAWLCVFIGIYYYYKNIKQLKNAYTILKLLIVTVFLILTGSKGALILLLLFIALDNIDIITHIKQKQQNMVRFFLIIVMISAIFILVKYILPNIYTYEYRITGLERYINKLSGDWMHILFGNAELAYNGGNRNYVQNLRNFFGWEGSAEIAYLNILVKNGILGMFAYLLVFIRMLKKAIILDDKKIRKEMIVLMSILLVSGFVETYFVTLHTVVGPFFYCVINGLYGSYKKVEA